MMKKGLCLLLALCCAFLLGGCTGGRIEEDQTPVSTLPPAEARYSAPDGDEAIPDVREYNMYFPGRDGLSLVSRSVKLETDNLNDAVEKLTNCLFSFRGDGEAKALGGEQPLALYGAHPIEISGGVCTVNLARSVMNLKKTSDYYKNCVAIATTLCELKEINGVNVLVADQSFPLDIAGLLPVGTMMANSGASLQGQWEQMDARKTPINGDPEKTPLSALATIYYPLPDNRGVGCAMRRLNFAGQTPAQLTSGLIDEISSVRRSLTGGEKFPELKSLLLHEPVLSELEGSRRILTLSLREDAAEKLEEARTDVACFAAAATLTLTTFIPGIYAVCIRIGGQPVTQEELKTSRFEPISVLSGMVERRTLQQFLMGSVTVYFARNGILCECERPVASGSVNSFRTQLCALMEGPDPTEREEGIRATLPEAVREDDILGISAEGDTLLVNLSESFRAEIQAQGPEAETLICYSMVNTLCRNTGMKRVRFFFEGEQQEYVAGTIYWAGEFMYNIGLAEKGLG